MPNFSSSHSQQPKVRVVVVMNTFHIAGNILMNQLIHDENIEVVGIVFKRIWSVSKKPSRQNIMVAWHDWSKKVGFWFLFSIISMTIWHFLKVLILDILILCTLVSNPKYWRSTRALSVKYGIPYFRSYAVNNLKTEEFIRSHKPDVLLLNNFNQIVAENIITIAKHGCINVHPGKLPLYRGVLPYFWSMVREDSHNGVTIHYVDEGLDTGDILASDEYPIHSTHSFYQVWKKSAFVASKLLSKVFFQLRNNTKKLAAQPQVKGKSKRFRFPRHKDYQRFRRQGKVLLDWKGFFEFGS